MFTDSYWRWCQAQPKEGDMYNAAMMIDPDDAADVAEIMEKRQPELFFVWDGHDYK